MNARSAGPPVLRPLDALPRVDVLGTRVTAARFDEAVAALAACVAEQRPAVFAAANVYSVMLGVDDPGYRALVNRAHYVMADGMPLVWMLRRQGHPCERVHGDDLLLACAAAHPEWRWFLLGGAVGQPEAAAAALAARFPALRVVGTRATPVRPVPPDETRRALDEIRRCDADVVWVGMGTPAQDLWMAEHGPAVGRPVIGVGSAFDLLAGRTRPTPGWMKASGLQWLHRLLQEPRRLAGRYAVYNTRFAWRAAGGLLRGRGPRGGP